MNNLDWDNKKCIEIIIRKIKGISIVNNNKGNSCLGNKFNEFLK